MDYSLLVGVHFRDDTTGEKMGLSPFVLRSGKLRDIILYLCLPIDVDLSVRLMSVSCAGRIDSYKNEKFMRGCRFLEAELQDMDRILAGR